MNDTFPIVYTPVSLKLPSDWLARIDAHARKEGHAGRSGWLRGVIGRELELLADAGSEGEKAA